MHENRKWAILALISLTSLIFLVKLLSIQVLNDEYKRKADGVSIKTIPIYPHRGVILDRNSKELVVNIPVFDLIVIPAQVRIPDTLALCELLNLEKSEFVEEMGKAMKYSMEKPSTLLKQISRSEFHRIQDRLIDYPGFYPSSRTIRHYPENVMAHALGYIGEISEGAKEQDTSKYYALGDYVGISGIEATYERELRGVKGVRYVWRDNMGREKGKFKEGRYDTASIAGTNLIATVDLEIQKYAEELMQHKKGAIVAIEPATGEVLAMVSAPTYNPNLLTGRSFSQNFGNLLLNENKPLFNRAIRAKYPPGSTFKTVQSLIAQQEGVINRHTVFACNKALVKCHFHPTCDLQHSIQHSCNPYYYRVFRRIVHQNKITMNDSIAQVASDGDLNQGYQTWLDYMDAFNLGRKTGIDLANEIDGYIPEIELYNDRYGEDNWNFSNIYSLGIGQGEVGVLPLQLANLAAIIANRGYYYTPHLIKKIGEQDKRPEFKIKHAVPVDEKHFDLITQGMYDAYKMGTVAYYAIIPGLDLCGKTGTAQNPHGEDHSVFIAFAPRENPKIAIAVTVENAGFGGSWAAPIAALLVDKYLNGEISKPSLDEMVRKKSFVLEPNPVITLNQASNTP